MALTNCTINSTSVEVTPSQALGSGVANQVLTITPNTGFRVSAADFTNNTGSLTGVTSITLANSSTAYAADNKVTVTVDLDDSFNPGTSNHTLTIDIDGAAILVKDVPRTLSGVFNVTVNNAVTAASNQAYSASGSVGETKDLFTRTVTATGGNYFEVAPTIEVATGDVSNYVITATPNGTGTSHTATTFDVDGIMPFITDTADVINIDARAVAIPVATNQIRAYSHDTSQMTYALTKRTFKAYGDVGAKFKIAITRTGDSHTYNFTTEDFTSASTDSGNLTIGSDGIYETLIAYPAVSADVTYTITLTAVSPTTLSLGNLSNPFTISRAGFINLTVSASSASRTFQSNVVAYTNHAGTTINHSGGANAIRQQSGHDYSGGNDSEFNFTITIDDDEAFVFKSSSLANSVTLDSGDYNVTPNNLTKAVFSEGSITAARAADGSGNANQLLTITGTAWYNNQMGTANTAINFNVDEFCNLPSSGGGGSGTILSYEADFYNSSGFYTGTHYLHLTQTCQSGNAAVTCMNFASLSGKWVRVRLISQGCSSTEYVAQVGSSSTTFNPTVYASGDTYYNSRTNAENSQNGITC